jgi:hypothetical protein
MTIHDNSESVAEPVLRHFDPKPVNWRAVNAQRIVISYDRPSDTLLVHLFGRGRSSVSVPVDRYLYVMVDPDTEETIGIHIEGFIGQAVKEHPRQIDILDYAELRGMTPGEVRAMQRAVLGLRHRLATELRAAWRHSPPADKAPAIRMLLDYEPLRWRLPDDPAA